MNGTIITCEENLQPAWGNVAPAVDGMVGDTIEQDYYFALSRATRYVSRLCNRHLAGASVTVGQFAILLVLREHGYMTMAELGEVLVMERTSLLRALKPMVSTRLVEKGRHPHYGLRCVLKLTEAGRERVKQGEMHATSARLEIERAYGSSRAVRLRAELFSLTR
jgi:DNA-binding MarR family transcriptional regulator